MRKTIGIILTISFLLTSFISCSNASESNSSPTLGSVYKTQKDDGSSINRLKIYESNSGSSLFTIETLTFLSSDKFRITYDTYSYSEPNVNHGSINEGLPTDYRLGMAATGEEGRGSGTYIINGSTITLTGNYDICGNYDYRSDSTRESVPLTLTGTISSDYNKIIVDGTTTYYYSSELPNHEMTVHFVFTKQ